jgi:hypothetical protein
MRVATIMKNANDLLFVSPRYTGEIIRSGKYLQIVRGLEPLLNQSLIEFDHAKCKYQPWNCVNQCLFESSGETDAMYLDH